MARYLEGKHAALKALLASCPLVKAYVQKGFSDRELLQKLQSAQVAVQIVDRAQINKLSKRGAHQGIVCEVAPFSYTALEMVLTQVADKRNVCVLVLDHITDEGNLGAIARSAEALGAAALIIPKDRSAEVGAGAYKTSAGAVFSLPIVQVTNLAQTLEKLKQEGFWAIAATEHAEAVIYEADLSGRTCIVMGSEQKGVSEGVLKHADVCVSIPQQGRIESLNVAQAATVLLYEWSRQCAQSE